MRSIECVDNRPVNPTIYDQKPLLMNWESHDQIRRKRQNMRQH